MTFNIDTATGPELVAEHNRLAALLGLSPTKRFADRETGVLRTAKLLAILAEQTKKPWGLQRENRHHRLNCPPNKKGAKWAAFQDAIQEEADEDGTIDVEAVKARFPGVTTQIWAGWWTMAKRLEIAFRDDKTGEWVIEQ